MPSMLDYLLSNVHSLHYKCNELHSIAVNYNSAVIAASEIWLNADISDSANFSWIQSTLAGL